MYIFGNSLSDTDAGYSDGPLWPEYLAPQLGFAYDSTGNYAAPGASSLVVLGQVDSYQMSTVMADPNALYVVWALPSNDIGAVDAVNNIVTAVDSLSAFGATNILIPNMPDAGLSPGGTDAGTALSIYFNSTLESAFTGMANVTIVDLFTLHHDIYDDPAAYGFSNVTDSCSDTAPDECGTYMFWDNYGHPTTVGHSIFAVEFAASISTVPIPAAAWLFGSGLLGLIGVARRKVRV
jgi:phospholipase/lecithinase/hemolysin